MKRMILALAGAVLLAGLTVVPGHGDEGKKSQALMKRKLEQAQKVLAGIALNDFEVIGKHAEELIAISKEAEWMVLKTPKYEIYSNDFRRIADSLVKNAKDRNLDAATLSYVDMTLTCVKCHKHVREVRQVRANTPEPAVVRGP
jgi:hypothetical protein